MKNYTDELARKSAAAKAERMRTVSREDFRGTGAMEKLGIRVEGSAANYGRAEQLRKNHEAAQSIRKDIRQAERRLHATAEEKYLASGIAAGTIDEGSLAAHLDHGKIQELADYYFAERTFGLDLLRQQRADLNRLLGEQADHYFKDTDEARASGAFTLNNRTPERNILKMFGDEKGAEINRWLFDPVAANEGERLRFVNRMHDEVRVFEDSSGRKSKPLGRLWRPQA